MPPKASTAAQQQLTVTLPPDSNDAPDAPDAPDVLIGRVLNDTYQVESLIGQGGVGRVYQARHCRIRTKLFALKVLHPEHARDTQQLARFQQEAEAAASLSHPHVVGVYDVGRTSDGFSYLACELLLGLDLEAYVTAHGPLDLETALVVGLQICEALESAHAQQVVHRDLKPQNVFLQFDAEGEMPRQPHVKLLDFGLSRFLDNTDNQLTKTGTVMGTPAFMAPEQAMGKRGDHRVDVYGIGVILYAALTGRPPFQEATLTAMLVSVMTQEPPRPRKLAPDLPEAMELVIQRAMSKDADDRYASVAELKAALQNVMQGEELSPAEPSGHRPPLASIAFSEDNYSLRTSRPRLVFYSLGVVVVTLAVLTSAISGLELITGPISLSLSELALILAGTLGTIAMPAALALRSFRRNTWSNSARVIDALERVRAPLSAALLTYGATSIGLRFCDDFVSRFGSSPLFVQDPGLGWPGFTFILPAVAGLVAGITFLKKKVTEGPSGAKRRPWLGAPLWFITILGILFLTTWGLRWRAEDLHQKAAIAAALEQRAAAQRAAAAQREAVDAQGPPPEPVRFATDDELAAAIAQGTDGLLPLSEEYPKDPHVLEPLLLAFASRATGLADAMVTADQLLDVAPEKRDSETLGVIVLRAARTPGNASERALALMTTKMGESGADLIYQLSKSDEKVGAKARELLDTDTVQASMSSALRVLLELEDARSCEERLPYLARAAQLGDMRSAALLIPLTKGAKTGCGKWKSRPCLPACGDHLKEYFDAINAIQRRAGASEL